MTGRLGKPLFRALDPASDGFHRAGILKRQIVIVGMGLPPAFRHPADQDVEVVGGDAAFGRRGRGPACEPIGQDLANPILEAQTRLARRRLGSVAGLGIEHVEVREDGSSHGRACGDGLVRRQQAPTPSCRRVGGRSRSGMREACGDQRADGLPSAGRGKKAVKAAGLRTEPRVFAIPFRYPEGNGRTIPA